MSFSVLWMSSVTSVTRRKRTLVFCENARERSGSLRGSIEPPGVCGVS